jgi:hypothetical protein
VMHKRPSTHSVMVFCEKYKVSFDWILCGDLTGLQRMIHDRKLRSAPRPLAERIRDLRPDLQKIIETMIDQLLEQSS